MGGEANNFFMEFLQTYELHSEEAIALPPPLTPSFPRVQVLVQEVQGHPTILFESNWYRFKDILIATDCAKIEVRDSVCC